MKFPLPRLLLALCVAWTAQSQAAGLRVSPVRLDVSGRQPNAELTLTNLTSINNAVQIEVMEWRQVNGRDELLPTRDVVFAPPIAVIPASGVKKLRFNLRRPPDAAVERSYRVIVKEIEPPRAVEEQAVGMRMMLQISLPLFVAPSRRLEPGFVPALTREAAGPLNVSLQNTGNAHIRVQSVELYEGGYDPQQSEKNGQIDATPIETVSTSLNGTPYVLVANTQTWQVPSTKLKPGQQYWLLARTDCYRSRTVPVNRYGYLWQKLIVADDGTLSSELRPAD